MTLTDVGDALLAQLRDNCKMNADVIDEGSCVVKEMRWGEDISKIGKFDLVICSDLLYCAFRDGLETSLLSTIEYLVVGSQTTAVLAFKVRIPDKEKLFMSDLAKRELNIKEVARSELDFSDLQPEGIFASMFSHKDDTDIRLFLVRVTKK